MVPTASTDRGEHEGAWSRRGPVRYSAEFADEGNVAAFSIRLPGTAGKSTSAGRAKVFGDAVEWVLDGDGPKAAVLPIWRGEMQAEGPEREVQEFAEFKIRLAKSARSGPPTRAGRGTENVVHQPEFPSPRIIRPLMSISYQACER